MKALIDFIPMLLFFYLYKTTDPSNAHHPLLQLIGSSGGDGNNHILVATVGLIASMLVVYSGLFVSQRGRLDKQQWFVLVMTVVFGGVTLALSDDYYIRLKAVLINIAFGLGLLIAPVFLSNKEPVVKKLFDSLFELSSKGWQRLNYAWAGMFFVMACLHGFFAFVFASGRYWGEFTAFGDLLVMLCFVIVMFVVLKKHLKIEQ